ncbi:MAG: SgcJ/EcaC family oxidoreductase [Bryobacteraceae bacterium]|nr:SgcJ/EcaC family oxidoreductase [Bryobacteraceae bacterium]
MDARLVLVTSLMFCACRSKGLPQGSGREDRATRVRATVSQFYASFDDGFTKPPSYATEDWYHINPYGAVDKGLAATMKTVGEVHQTFLKGTTDRVKDIDIRFASDDVAVATVTSEMSPFTSPDGVHHALEGHVRTFVVVKREDRWLIMQDHNTTIVPPRRK